MHWIQRTLEQVLAGSDTLLKPFAVWLVLGPRQVGKSSLLKHCATEGRAFVDLDDLATRERANRDPMLFAQDLTPPVLIDEIQYAPRLLSPIKRWVDSGLPPGAIWLTGSQSFEVMAGVQESLAGRVAILNLFGLSDEEKRPRVKDAREYFQSLARSSFPKLHGVHDRPAIELYLSSYAQTYIERDVREIIGLAKRREFETFVRMCALRTGQLLNVAELARDAGISAPTAREWIGVLEDSFLLKLVHPYFTNRTKRLMKSPKLYFIDMGLAAHLAGWRDPEMLRLGPMAGAAFETHVFGQILRHFRHRALGVDISFWRTRDGAEIDFLVETSGACYPVEVKLGSVDPASLEPLAKIRDPHWKPGTVFSLLELGSTQPKRLTDDWKLSSPDRLPWVE